MQFCISFLSLFAQNAVTLPKFLEDAGLSRFSAFPETHKFPEKQEYSVLSMIGHAEEKDTYALLPFLSLSLVLVMLLHQEQAGDRRVQQWSTDIR